MSRRWLGSADVEVNDETGALLVEGEFGGGGASAPASITAGEKTVASAATPEPLVGSATPCRRVWVGAPVAQASGAAENTRCVLIGGSGGQQMPLMPSNFEGFFLDIDDAQKLYAKVGADGEKVRYAILA